MALNKGSIMQKYVDGVLVDLTEDEIAEREALEAEWVAGAYDRIATAHRITRNKILAESDWTQMNDSPLNNEMKTAWATYRQELRDLSDLDAWPNLADDDWPVAP